MSSPIRLRLRLLVLLCVLFFRGSTLLQAQINIDQTYTPLELVEDIFIAAGDCQLVENFTYAGDANSVAYFNGGGGTLFDEGILMSTGFAATSNNPGGAGFFSSGNSSGGTDPDLASISSVGVNDACIFEFDFIPQSDFVQFNYIFASEEYPEYAGTAYNDVFGFFLSGPGIAGPYADGAINIATLPGSGIPVSINTVNNTTNAAYYVANTGNQFVMDGYTVPLVAEATVIPCETYHIKIAIADGSDSIFDSVVLLEAGSFDIGGGTATAGDDTGEGTANTLEDCVNGFIRFERSDLTDLSEDVVLEIDVAGTATEGVDYIATDESGAVIDLTSTTTVTIPAGEEFVYIYIEALGDAIPEGVETVSIQILNIGCVCETPPEPTELFIYDYLPLDATISGDDEICPGETSTLIASAVGGLVGFFPYQYEWSTGETTNDIDVSPIVGPETYFVTVTDLCGNTAEADFTVNVTPVPDVIIDPVDPVCEDGAPITLTATPAGGTWIGTGVTNPVSGAFDPVDAIANGATSPITITYQIIDPCVVEETIEIALVPPPTATISGTGEICDDGSNTFDLTITFDAVTTAPWEVVYALDGAAQPAVTTSDNPFSLTVADAGTYTLVSVDSGDGCPGTVDGSATISLITVTPVISPTDALCFGVPSGSLTTTVTGGTEPYMYTWSGPTAIGDTPDEVDLLAGDYSLTVTDAAGCTGETTVTISAPPNIDPPVITGPTYCQNDPLDPLEITLGAGATGISWYNADPAATPTTPFSFSNPLDLTSYVDNTVVGTTDYWVSQTDDNGCESEPVMVTITINALPVFTITPPLVCDGDTLDLTTLTTGITGTVTWLDVEGGTPIPTEQVITGDVTFWLDVDDGTCSDGAPVAITMAPLPTVDIVGPPAFCTGGSTILNAVPGGGATGSFLWNTGETTTAITVDTPGDYSVVFTNDDGCEAEAMFTIEEIIITLAAIPVPIECDGSGGNIDLTVGGNPFGTVSYDWSDDAFDGIEDPTGLAIGFYSVTVTDEGGCFEEELDIEIVGIASPLEITLTPTLPSCNGAADATITVETTGGDPDFIYDWSDDALDGIANPTTLTAGDYSVTVTDANGCDAEASVSITDPAIPTIDGSADPACEGGDATLTAISYTGFDVTFDWVGPDGTAYTGDEVTITDVSDTQAGPYTVTATIDGCPSEPFEIILEVVPPPPAGFIPPTVVCNTTDGGSTIDLATLSPSADGYWTDDTGATITDTMLDFDGSTPGSYLFTYIEPGTPPCEEALTEAAITVEDCSCPSLAMDVPPVLCADAGTVDLTTIQITTEPGVWSITASPGTPEAVIQADGVTFDVTGAAAGDYELTYTLDGPIPVGCEDFTTIIIPVQAPVNAGEDGGQAVCNDQATPIDLISLLTGADTGGVWTSDGTADAAAFDAAAGTFNPDGHAAGSFTFTYTVTAVDPCPVDEAIVTITVDELPIAGTPTPIDVCNDGSVTTSVDLFAQLAGADTGGAWTLAAGSDLPDTGTFDPIAGSFFVIAHPGGTYTFTYTVTGNGACPDATADVTVNISEPADAGTGSSMEVCNDVLTLINLADLLTDADTGGTWTSDGTEDAGTFDATGGTFTVILNTPGTYTFTYTLPANIACPGDSEDVSVTVFAPANAGDGSAIDVCNDQTDLVDLPSLISGADAMDGTWSISTDGDTPNASAFDATALTFNPAAHPAGSYSFTYELSSGGICPADETTVTVNVVPAPNAGENGSDVSCNTGGLIDLFATLGGSPDVGGTWDINLSSFFPTGTSFDAVAGTFDPTGQVEGTYSFDYVVAGATPCTEAIATVSIDVEEQPIVELTPTANACNATADGSIVNLNDLIISSNATGNWIDVASGNVVAPTVDFDGDDPGVYQFNYETTSANDPCTDETYTIEVLVEDCGCPSVATQATAPVCNSDASVDLTTMQVTTEAGTWTLGTTPAGSTAAITGTTFSAVDSPAGDYEVIFTLDETPDNPDCPTFSTQTIAVSAAVTAGTGSPTDICNDQTALVDLASLLTDADLGGAWTLTDGTLDAGTFDAIAGTFDPSGHSVASLTFTYTVTGVDPCPEDTEEVFVNVAHAPDAGTPSDISLCNDATALLDLNSLLDGAETGGTWTSDGTEDASAFDAAGATFDPAGHPGGAFTFTYTLTATPPCVDAVESVTVTIEAAPTAGTGSSTEICNSSEDLIDLNGMLTGADAGGVWTLQSGTPDAGAFDAFAGTFNPSGQTGDTYEFLYTVTTCAVDDEVVTVVVSEQPFADLVPNINVCNTTDGGSTLNFDDMILTGLGLGAWNDDDGSGASGSFPNLDFDGTTPGLYNFTYTLAVAGPACTDPSYTIEVLVEDCACPSVATTGAGPFCNDAATIALADLTITTEAGTWSFGTIPDGSTATLDATNFDANGSAAGDYELIFTLDATPPDGCPTSSTQTINIQEAVNAGTGSDMEVCNSSTDVIDLNMLLTGADADGVWAVTAGTPDAAAVNLAVGTFDPAGHAAGDFTFTYSLAAVDPCVSSDATVIITVNDQPAAVVTPSVNTCNTAAEGSTVNFDGLVTDGDLTGTWSDDSGTFDATAFPLIDFDGQTPGTWTFTYSLTSALGSCVNPTYTVEVLVEDCTCPSVATTGAGPFCNDDAVIDLADMTITDEAGTWTFGTIPDGATATITANTLDANGSAAGDYELIFTLDETPDNPDCPTFSTQVVTIAQAVNAGTGSAIEICNNSTTVVNLHDLIEGEDLGGTWTLDATSAAPDAGMFDDLAATFDPAAHTAGVYVFNYGLTTTAPCTDSDAQVTVTVYDQPAVEVTPDASVCNLAIDGSTVNLADLVISSTDVLTWADVDGSGASGTLPDLDFDGVDPGTYTFTCTIAAAGTCTDAVGTITVLVQDCACPSVETIGGGPICNDGDLIDLADLTVTAEPGAWTITNAPADATATITSNVFDPSGSTAGDYELTFTLTTDPGPDCPNASVQTITVNAPLNAGTPAAPLDVCADDTNLVDLFSLLDGEDTGGVWTSNGDEDAGALDATAGTFNPLAHTAGTVTFTYTVTPDAPCDPTDATVTIIVDPCDCEDPAPPVIVIGDIVICEGDLIGNFEVTTADNTIVNWYDEAVGGTLLGTGLTFAAVDAGTYYAEAINDPDDGCASDRVPATLTVNPIPVAEYTPSAEVACVGDEIIFEFTGTAAPDANITWTLGSAGTFTGAGPHTVSWAVAAEETITIAIEQAGCTDEITGSVQISSIDVSTASNTSVLIGSSVTLDTEVLSPLDLDYTYEWMSSSAFSEDLSELSPVVTPTETTTYTITVTDEIGCTDTGEVIVGIYFENTLIIPNAFSPNGDGVNDTFFPLGINVDKISYVVYDRWGNQLYEQVDAAATDNGSWDGMYKGKLMEVGVYVFAGSVTFTDGTVVPFKGNVSLIR